MILTHNIGFVGGGVVRAGDKLSAEQEKALKASGTKYFEVKKSKKKIEAPKEQE